MKIYTDSSYDWNKTDSKGCGEGEICIAKSKKNFIREKLTICVPGLKQLNNRFELIAIYKALKLYGEKKNIEILSDSQVAVGWAADKRVKWIPREKNIAGKILEE